MAQSDVYMTDFRTVPFGDTMPEKLQKLIRRAGIGDIDFDSQLTAIKMHFGELGNMAYLRPGYAKAVADVVKELGGKPFLTDCNTLYVGSRKNALEHLSCAAQNGFSWESCGCPILIGDGLKGTDEALVLVQGDYIQEAKIGQTIMDADVFISLAHFKGHENAGFGGTIKNVGMGCASRAGKMEQHAAGKPKVDPTLCRGCRRCQKMCAHGAIAYGADGKAVIDHEKCAGCGRCIGGCNFDAITLLDYGANRELNCRMAEYTLAVVQDRPAFYINIVADISPNCDCHAENDAPILPDIGMFASFDPVALDQACVDACMQAEPLPNSQLTDNMGRDDFVDRHDPFLNSTPDSEWESGLEHAEKIGLGHRSYTLHII